jgi:hypothetical protein
MKSKTLFVHDIFIIVMVYIVASLLPFRCLAFATVTEDGQTYPPVLLYSNESNQSLHTWTT